MVCPELSSRLSAALTALRPKRSHLEMSMKMSGPTSHTLAGLRFLVTLIIHETRKSWPLAAPLWGSVSISSPGPVSQRMVTVCPGPLVLAVMTWPLEPGIKFP